MSSRAVSCAILMVPTALMLYSIGLSVAHEPAFRKANAYDMISDAAVGDSRSAATPQPSRAAGSTMLARPVTIERCRAVTNRQKLEPVCLPMAAKQNRA